MIRRGALGPPSYLSSLSNSGFQGPPFKPLNIKHMISWNNPNGEMDEGHIWLGSITQTNRKQNALSLCDCGNA